MSTPEVVDEQLIILMPVYNDWDALGRLLPALAHELCANGLRAAILLVYLDCVGVLLSLGNVLALRRALPTRSQIVFWDSVCVPISRLADRLLRGNFGKSVLAVWQKNTAG